MGAHMLAAAKATTEVRDDINHRLVLLFCVALEQKTQKR